MKTYLRLLYRLSESFGVLYGLKLFIKYKLNNISTIKLPHYPSNIYLRDKTSDFATFLQVFVNKDYKIKFNYEPKVIVDGGANIGLFTILMKNKFPGATVICVEPDKENFELLKKNVQQYKNVHCEHCGLWNKKANLIVYDKFGMGKWGLAVEESKEDGDTKAISMDDLINSYALKKIDVLKLDIETSEKILFMDNYESWLPKVRMIIIELHDYMEQNCSKPFFQAVNKSFDTYTYSMQGENTIIINNDLNEL